MHVKRPRIVRIARKRKFFNLETSEHSSDDGDAVKIQTPPRTLRVNGLSTNEYNDLKNAERRSKTTHDLQSLTSKYPQYREADTFNPLRQYDFDEEQLLADLDATSEVEKLRQQNFKLNRK